jgi:O-antigen/teichoic acid export membrane protein
VIVSVVAAAELANAPAVRDFFANYYTGPSETPYRPSSTMGHYSAVGGLGLLTYIVALAIATARKPDFPGWWLAVVMGASLMGVIASETWAPLAVLPVATGLMFIYGRRVPRELIYTVVIGAAVAAVLWPLVSSRVDSQQLFTFQGLALPESMQTRISYWNEFIIPALADHLWVGTGTLIPSTVPDNLTTFVDNEYLWAGFRAGIPGIALLVIMLVVIFVAGWNERRSADPSRRALGGAAAVVSGSLVLLGATAQYITFAGLSQEVAMVIGLLGALTTQVAIRKPAVVVLQVASEPVWMTIPRAAETAMLELRQYRPDHGFLRSSAVVFAGFATARALGFLFSVAAARILDPVAYGRLTYALALVTVTSMFVSSSPTGLSRFLSRNHQDRDAQRSYLVNWIAVIATIAIASAIVVTPVVVVIGLSPGLIVALLCNFAGIAVLEGYREIQRGLDRYSTMTTVYVAGNLVQLAGIVALGVLGVRSAAVFLAVYGLSSVVAFIAVQAVSPIGLGLVLRDIAAPRIREILLFIRPVLAQSVFFAVWFGSDVIMVQHLMTSRATANYAVAKALVNVLLLAPTAIGTAVLPRVARMAEDSVGRYVATTLGLTGLVTVPLVAASVLLGPWLIPHVFGTKYPDAGGPVAILSVGMGIYAFYTVLGSIWVGLGRPLVDSIATGLAMTVTVGTGLVLIPHIGLDGAAVAFTSGAAMRLLVMGTFTLSALTRSRSRRAHIAMAKLREVEGTPAV